MHPEPVHSIRSVFHSWKRLSIQLFFIALLTGGFCACSSGTKLTKEFLAGEQARVDAYYDLRAHGAPFQSLFYNDCDSVHAKLPASNLKLLTIYTSIALIRPGDSTGRYKTFIIAKDLLDADFAIANGRSAK